MQEGPTAAILLVCFATMTQSLQISRSISVSRAFEEAGIVPKIIPKAPADELKMFYETVSVDLGNFLCPLKTIMPPTLDFATKAGSYYTVIIFNPDVPSRDAPALRSLILALYVNMINTDLNLGFSLAPYIPPTPPPGSSVHRYIALVYEQNGAININNPSLIDAVLPRVRFSVRDFASNYSLRDPIAGNFFYAELPYDYEQVCHA